MILVTGKECMFFFLHLLTSATAINLALLHMLWIHPLRAYWTKPYFGQSYVALLPPIVNQREEYLTVRLEYNTKTNCMLSSLFWLA